MGGAEGFCGPDTFSLTLISLCTHAYSPPFLILNLNGSQQTEFNNPAQIQFESLQSVEPLQSHHVFCVSLTVCLEHVQLYFNLIYYLFI